MKQQTKGGALHRLWQALPWLWMAAAYLFDLWYSLCPANGSSIPTSRRR